MTNSKKQGAIRKIKILMANYGVSIQDIEKSKVEVNFSKPEQPKQTITQKVVEKVTGKTPAPAPTK